MQDILLNYGPLGVAVVAEGLAIIYLFKRLDKIQEDRLQDARDTRDKLIAPIEDLGKVSATTATTMDNIYKEVISRDKRGN